jgi:chromosome segregation ATPase
LPRSVSDSDRRLTYISPPTGAKAGLREELERSRTAITTEETEIGRIEEALAALPALKEHLKRFAAAGLEEKLKGKTQIDKEGRLFEQAEQMVSDASELAAGVLAQGTPEGSIVGTEAKGLPNGAIVAKLDKIQADLLQKIATAGKIIEPAVKEATKAVGKIKSEWTPKQVAANELYQKTLKQLKADGHDAGEFVQYKDRVERLKPKEAELKTRKRTLTGLQKTRRELLAKWDAAKAEDYRELQKAARKVSRRLKDRVRVSVRPSATLDQLEAVIRKHCSGNFSQPLERLPAIEDLNLTDLGSTVVEGPAQLVSKYGFSQNAAERIARGGTALALEIEECEVPVEAVLELNVGNEKAQTWKELAQLSTGQKATAVLLLLLLLESDAPLVVDQPEDDLDNRSVRRNR